MRRRRFLQLLGLGAGVAVLAPELLADGLAGLEPASVSTLMSYELRNTGTDMGYALMPYQVDLVKRFWPNEIVHLTSRRRYG